MSRCQNLATSGNLRETKTFFWSPQPGDIGKLLNENVLNKREIKKKSKN